MAITTTGFTLALTLAWTSGLSLPEPAFHSHALRRVYFLLTTAGHLTIRERRENCGAAIQVYVPVSSTQYPEAHSVRKGNTCS
jgi:hypothetical protein